MTVDQFQRELRSHKHRQPYRPFVVVLNDGRSIFVDEPAIAFDGGRAVFLGPEDVEIVDCEQVTEIRLVEQEPAA
jgi:hypothetical protein